MGRDTFELTERSEFPAKVAPDDDRDDPKQDDESDENRRQALLQHVFRHRSDVTRPFIDSKDTDDVTALFDWNEHGHIVPVLWILDNRCRDGPTFKRRSRICKRRRCRRRSDIDRVGRAHPIDDDLKLFAVGCESVHIHGPDLRPIRVELFPKLLEPFIFRRVL